MVPEDLKHCGDVITRFAGLRPKRILLLSPNIDQYRLFRRTHPAAIIYSSDRFMWDLAKPMRWRFDLIFAANVMHYSPSPRQWYANILDACEVFMVQDLVNRRRSEQAPFLGNDGDSARYEYRERGVISEHANAFDLGQLGARFVNFETYPTSSGALHFIALIEGRGRNSLSARDLAAPHLYALGRLGTMGLLVKTRLERNPHVRRLVSGLRRT